MEKFGFSYKDSLKRIKGIYTFNDKVKDNTFWEGYILVRNLDGLLYIEGYEIDHMDSLEKDGKHHLRYIYGDKAISHADGTISFEIFPGKLAPIHYGMHFNEDDRCFYGDWHFSPNENHPIPVSGEGEAIVYIEDAVDVDIEEIRNTIKSVSDMARREYASEIDTYKKLSDMLFFQHYLSNSIMNPVAVKKLSLYSSSVKQK